MLLSKLKFSKSKKSILILIVLVLTFLILGWNTSWISQDRLSAEMDRMECGTYEEVVEDSGVAGSNLWLISVSQVNRRLMNKYPCIKQVVLEKEYPNGARIKIKGREPLAAVVPLEKNDSPSLSGNEATPSSSAVLFDWSFPDTAAVKSFLADEDGFVYGENGNAELSFLFLPVENIQIGQKIPGFPFDKIKSVFVSLGKMQVPVPRAKIADGLLLVETQPRLIFSLEKDVLRQTASLQLILQKSKINGKTIQFVDLRFDKPVVVY